ncbi:MAG: putative metal-dependent hydrolase [bacterium]
MEQEMTELQYPIGQFEFTEFESEAERTIIIDNLFMIPFILRDEVENLTDEQLNTRYRDGGWTIRQVVHHLADSHVNAYVRFKLALTEDNPTIKPYREDLWAELSYSRTGKIDVSLNMLEALHRRLHSLLKNMTDEDFNKTYFHPEKDRNVSLNEALVLYEWHGRHHIAQITALKQRKSW